MAIVAREHAELPRGVVDELTAGHPFGAWRGVPRVPEAGALEHLRATITAAAARDDAVRLLAEDDRGRPVGLAVLQRLPDDSELLGIEAATVAALLVRADRPAPRDACERLARRLVEAAARAGFEHVTARVDAADTAARRALEGAGFRRIETLLTLTHERGRPTAQPAAKPGDASERRRIRAATVDDVPALRALAPRASAATAITATRRCRPGAATR